MGKPDPSLLHQALCQDEPLFLLSDVVLFNERVELVLAINLQIGIKPPAPPLFRIIYRRNRSVPSVG